MSQKHMCAGCPSADKHMETFVSHLSVETSFHRVKSQAVKCGFGQQGVCCRLCSNGPCRITPTSPRGICGANADQIVGRNFLRAVSAGSGCYIHVVETTARNLKDMAINKCTLKGVATLEKVCMMLDISGTDVFDKAIKIADMILADLYKPAFDEMEITKKLAYAPRYEKWKALGILPGGAKSEVFNGVVKTSTNLNSDPVDMLLHCLRLGISTGLFGLQLTNLLNDIMLGEAEIRVAPVGLRTIDPDYINIMVTGHQHSVFAHLQDYLIQPEAIDMAKKAGAQGFKIVGCTCVGQDLQLRGVHYQEIFNGHAGNNYISEAVLATGAVDVVLSEFNCTLPGIESVCDALQIKQICLDSVAKKANADLMQFKFEDRIKISKDIAQEAIQAYTLRRNHVPLNLMPEHGNDTTLTGISEVSLKSFLGNTWQPLIELIASGQIKGIAAVVGCSSLTAGGHDVLTVALTKELIAKDILVLTAGCSSGGIENCGLMSANAADFAGPKLKEICKQLGIPPALNFGPCLAIGRLEMVAMELAEALNIDIPQLPLVVSAPQWLEEQALADGAFALALGLPLHLGLPPFVTGSPIAVQVLCEDMKTLTGGHVLIGTDAEKAANQLDEIIVERRIALNLPTE